MPYVCTDCPVTGRPIDTGIEIDEESFARLPSFIGRIFCPDCRQEHGWSTDKARLADRKPSP
jgi:hypothetical protein